MNRKLILLLFLSGLGLFLSFTPEQRVASQGDIDFDEHCRRHGRERAVLDFNDVYGWRCEDSAGVHWPISVENACSEQHPGSRPEFTDHDNPYSWQCVGGSSPQPTQPPQVQPTAVPAQPQSPQQPQESVQPGNPQPQVPQGQGTGNLDLNAHCRLHGRERAVLLDQTVYGWKCQDASGVNWDISIASACQSKIQVVTQSMGTSTIHTLGAAPGEKPFSQINPSNRLNHNQRRFQIRAPRSKATL